MSGPFSLFRWRFRQRSGAAGAGGGLGLGIEGLPSSLLHFPPCQSQVLLVPEVAPRIHLLCQVAETALARELPLHVVLGPAAGDVLEACLARSARLADAVAGGRVQLLEWQPRPGETPAPAALLRELPLFQVAPEDGLVFLGMEALFAWDKPVALQQQLRALQQWVRQRPAGSLFLFAGQVGEALAVAGMDWAFPNAGRLVWEQGHLTLELLRWQGGLQNTCYSLQPADHGLEMEGGVLDGDSQRLRAAPRQGCVLVMEGALAGQAGVPAHWQVLPDRAALEAELPTLGASTLLLPYEGPAGFVELVHLVHRLRQAHPRYLKILVREMGAKLRYGAEAILLKAGINSVIYRELGFSRVIQQVHGHGNQIYSGEPCADLEGLLAAAEPLPVSGYLPPARFCQLVRRMVEQSSLLGVEHCLLRFSLLRRVTHLDALAHCRIGRSGDLVSTDREHLYLFLFACREPDVEASVNHIFREPVDTLFESTWIHPGSELILHALAALEREAEHGALPDHSALLAAMLPPAGGAPERPGVADPGIPAASPARLLLARSAGAPSLPGAARPPARQVHRFSLSGWRPEQEPGGVRS